MVSKAVQLSATLGLAAAWLRLLHGCLFASLVFLLSVVWLEVAVQVCGFLWQDTGPGGVNLLTACVAMAAVYSFLQDPAPTIS